MNKEQAQKLMINAKSKIEQAESEVQHLLVTLIKESSPETIEKGIKGMELTINGDECEIISLNTNKLTYTPIYYIEEEQSLPLDKLNIYQLKALIDFIFLYEFKE